MCQVIFDCILHILSIIFRDPGLYLNLTKNALRPQILISLIGSVVPTAAQFSKLL